MIKRYLSAYQKSGMGWDVYAIRIPDEDREILARIFKECRDNGFFLPRVREGKIVFSQMVQPVCSHPENYTMEVEE